MAENDGEKIDFTQLERELQQTIDADNKYWRENDAKFRAVNQKVSNYEEFRDIVKAAHLKPLEKSEKNAIQQRGKVSIWNSFASKKRQGLPDSDVTTVNPPLGLLDMEKIPSTVAEFISIWRHLDVVERFGLLQKIGPAAFGHLIRSEIPVGLLGDILHTMLAFTPSTSEVVFVVGVLEAMCDAKRFSLSLQFLSAMERTTCRQLLEKLESSLTHREQDLAEEGVTEWTLQELKKKYQVL